MHNIVAVMNMRYTKVLLCLLFIFVIFTLFSYHNTDYHDDVLIALKFNDVRLHEAIVNKFYSARKGLKTSNLGTWLFKDEDLSGLLSQENRTYVILVWKYWNWLKKRHVNHYGSSEADPLEGCSVSNCIFTGEDEKIETADAVVVHLQHGDIPQVENRNPAQKWIFLNDEAPKNAFSLSRGRRLGDLANVFNWSMTYRTDADIPVPYGRTVPLHKPIQGNLYHVDLTEIIPNWKKKKRDVLAAILISNCSVKYRINFIKELQKHMAVDVYGSCSNNATIKNRCPGHFRADCDPMSEYLFYLVLENSSCREYLTEKIWYHAYSKGAIPIIMGPSMADCELLLPPHSYIYVPMTTTDAQVKELAKQIIEITQNGFLMRNFHNWRNHFEASNEHGYFGTRSKHLCRICEAMNYNGMERKIYQESDLARFLDSNVLCNVPDP
ncbi:alpha-(1,3)-fucosyltransferase 7-like [Anticarsia gemmatalis]|uniref:alpha-(1,3)-fucosyltransferase 7-like n=1 Tax=Anticarsia gemmatalis TaxID=129554 RepID=UPI003F760533